MNPGEIHLIQFDPSIGSEIQKRRPGLVIQKSPHRSTVIVLPISSKKLTHPLYEVELRKDNQNRLYADSVVVLDQVKSFDKGRFVGKIGEIHSSQLAEIVTKFKNILQ
ncbi:MAG: type II toxin-antitoxin system PemK/MazF family toxin [candidate division KSB1 bacterium]|nr:type II toxin-antitoxin system PemK/MazF family toxin [candidate division KSB1 bacterium]MDZ7302073.1 type II toxin-antitoxin system PemK/MazF family toxin [candidate division KSB1 bacterium]MDZ7311115.1 type II toxin-antitoxin system PemK/MazF family toxin [candidate division KSB1 bacterium]